MDDETLAKFIECVQENECLWKINSKAYKDKSFRDKLWENIGKNYGISGEAAYKEFRRLREKYRREVDKTRGRSGAAGSKGSTWQFLSSLSFLDDAYKQRRTANSENWDSINIADDDNVDDEDDDAVQKKDTPAFAHSRSKTPKGDNSFDDIISKHTNTFMQALNNPGTTPHDDVLKFIGATFACLDDQKKAKFEQVLMELAMSYRYYQK